MNEYDKKNAMKHNDEDRKISDALATIMHKWIISIRSPSFYQLFYTTDFNREKKTLTH